MGQKHSPEEIRNTALAIALGLVLAVFFGAATSRANVAKAPASATELPPEKRTPVRMTPETIFDPPGLPPPAFSEPRDERRRTTLASWQEESIVGRAREELVRVTQYDNSYMEISGYPMGDVASDRGACTDVVVRSLRAIGIDLQPLVHDDVARDPAVYGKSAPDPRIDHRRVGSMFVFFDRHAMSLTLDTRRSDEFRPGDIVFYTRTTGNAEHVAIVSDRIGPRGLPLLIQNGGPKPVENDALDRGKLVGHFRVLPKR